jgi:hypothetical protein
MACAICKTRREKRHCPGVQGEICPICCGEQREETVACPLDCEYLRIAHEHEGLEKKDPAGMPDPKFRISQDFLRKNVELVMTLQLSLLKAALRVHAIDNDVKEALGGLARTYRTLESGLYYESRPTNPMAAAIFDAIRDRVADMRKDEDARGVHKLLDSQVLSLVVFLQQMEYAFNNGRARGRCFIGNLRTTLSGVVEETPPAATSLIV